MSINSVTITGNLTREPELRMAGTTPLLELGIAVNERKKNQDSGEWEDVPNFFDVQVWGQRGESLSTLLSKGSKVAVQGRLKYQSWINNDGDKRSRVSIVASDVDLMSKTGAGSSSAPKEDVMFVEDIPFF